MSIFDRLMASSIGLVPKPIVGRIAKRYVAGETLDQALAVARSLSAEGCCFTLDLLGEFETDAAKSDATAAAYLDMLDRIAKEGLSGNVSIKLTAIGLMASREATKERLRKVVQRAEERQNFVRIDMEDSPHTSETLALYRELRAEGLTRLGVVLQAYMRRTLKDIEALSGLAPSYRLCKGIYVEPETIAFKGYQEVRDNYLLALEGMLSGKASRVGIATHDTWLIQKAEEMLLRLQIPKDRYEFQMLLGVTETERRRLVAAGHPLRVYIPYGAEWYGYVVRRLKENPKIGRYVLKALFSRR